MLRAGGQREPREGVVGVWALDLEGMPPVELLHPWELAHTGRGSPSRGSQEPAVKASSTETRKYGYDRRAKFLP